ARRRTAYVDRVRRLALLCLLVPATASAQDALKVDLVPKAQKGQGQPQLVVKAQTELKKVTIDLKRSTDGKRIRDTAGPIYAGRAHEFALPMKKVGTARFAGTIAVELGNGQSGSMPLDVEVSLLPQLELTIAKDDVKLDDKRLAISASRPLAKVQVSLMADTGTPLGTTETEVSAGADGKYVVDFERRKGTVLRVAVKGWDEDGFFGGVDLFPWQVDIPHEEVNFRSGKSDIDKPEIEKLEGSFKLIRAAVDKYGKLAEVRLFIAGHTDTVGDAASNRALSKARARAIGGWFKRRGLKIPVLYAGFGEDVLAVQTPDETDEVRNRRAEYIVAVDPPGVDGAKWKPL
ncbi:MAG: OmpA family protein, partial [Deltaproteobacteria bacterium]